ncbi:hypothetical protein GW819_01100 [Candidatus Gracilibacteria bacterium]|nr:hypothetical protein [Candidatus Gracilibacteria bacterium]OIO75921.1 MAG: hypothetical protein AUJ87_03900 [Candidatus Gracilibacteria bacterium CG1_02_38_174]PIQ11757.1 MAG: hypothetical protein COW68_01900 [Candidatus Gracilibacteria bacterium CG18_big_fil_WC_8_21_14_2_50_38_16]PIQ42125.1 MAG: hypothetical protein COW06_00685 [Candidatus Gracilibacteria bacterium CG12_big_fil_rev_8_21_14_0_65_38_15]PIZ01391.1 MAG: hypothetical protein COY60_03740 [Candidatus Gracilibacteria bacterium CG_4
MIKKGLIIHKYESIIEIFEKISEMDSSEIQIEVEENNALNNYLNLKLLLYRFPMKRFSFITNNSELKKLGESLGIRFFQKNDDIEFEKEYTKNHILRHNFTFLEYTRYEIIKLFSKFVFFSKKKTLFYKNKKIGQDSNVFFLIIGLVASLSLLSFIFYFAVSKTYVTITPELGIKTVSRNIVFTQKEASVLDSKNTVNVRPVHIEIPMEYTFNVTSIDEMSTKNSYGTVEIYNELRQEQVFRPMTRFITDNGVVFKTAEWIKVPPTQTLSGVTVIGKTTTSLIADTYDMEGNIIGVRGNIEEGLTLTVPGLKFNRDKIYAKTTTAFVGGIDPKIHVLTEKEVTSFKEILTEKLKSKALEKLKDTIKKANTENGEDYAILPINDNIIYTVGDLLLAKDAKIGDKGDEVTIAGKIKISTYTYDRTATLFYLKTILNESLLFGTEKLIGINDESLRITNAISKTTVPQFSLKGTTELDATISYNFEDSSNNLTKKLKNLIVGTSPKEATSILLNDNNIASVKITFSPFWLTNVSNNPDNIEFIIQK